eukprot:10026190-Alexandrium_andersonii.AAC.1
MGTSSSGKILGTSRACGSNAWGKGRRELDGAVPHGRPRHFAPEVRGEVARGAAVEEAAVE